MALRKDTKADRDPPEMEAEIMEIANVTERCMGRAGNLNAIVWLYEVRRARERA